jgi:hypothetical protein
MVPSSAYLTSISAFSRRPRKQWLRFRLAGFDLEKVTLPPFESEAHTIQIQDFKGIEVSP